MKFTLYKSDYAGKLANCVYPHKCIITDEKTLAEAVRFDHVMAEYKNNYRGNSNFVKSDNIPLDCDNEHSDKEADWCYPKDVAATFPGVAFAAVYSRNNMKEKGGRTPRPRFHIYFVSDVITDDKEYSKTKQEIQSIFPFFDANALDSGRFLFGVAKPKIEIYDGDKTISQFLNERFFERWDKETEKVPEGKRNSTMSHFAGRLLKRFGNTSSAFDRFMSESEKCSPPLDDSELKVIWNSAVKFWKKISQQENYIPPEKYNVSLALRPDDFSDVGQALILAAEYANALRYSPSTDYMVYNGSYWEESKPKAQGIAQELTSRQLEEAESELFKLKDEMLTSGVTAILNKMSEKKALTEFTEVQAEVFARYKEAVTYKNFVIKRRESKNITATLKEARPMLEVEHRVLDADEYLLNTPTATYDLRTGVPIDHTAINFITKQTAVSPDNEGSDKWESALELFFCGNTELIEYVQKIVGLSAIGKVYVEALIIAYGEGRNGKSTFWNTVARVLGSYSGNISADVLTVGCRRNVKPELAEAKGKRLLIAAELEEGMRLSTSNVKQLCSTDEIYAEKKYKDPFSYVPTHTLVLYTNHLPRVGALDKGTWRRLIVIPFEANIESKQDIKNYSDYLFEHAGGSVLSWIIEGAKKVIAENCKIKAPKVVSDAINAYRENNDWLTQFIDECCEIDEAYSEKSGQLYTEYRAYCGRMGDFARSTTDFYTALESAGYGRKKTIKGMIVKGLKIKSEFLE